MRAYKYDLISLSVVKGEEEDEVMLRAIVKVPLIPGYPLAPETPGDAPINEHPPIALNLSVPLGQTKILSHLLFQKLEKEFRRHEDAYEDANKKRKGQTES